MTPKEKAIDLFKKVDEFSDISYHGAKSMAIMFCDEILETVMNQFGDIEGTCYGIDDYWEEVKKELETLKI